MVVNSADVNSCLRRGMPTTTAVIWLFSTAAAAVVGGALAETKTQYESYEFCYELNIVHIFFPMKMDNFAWFSNSTSLNLNTQVGSVVAPVLRHFAK